MVQSLGISVGNQNSYVAAGQGGGIEILLNEYSNRATPSMVAFTDHSRSIGVDASSNIFMNIKNTIYDLMVLLGKSYREIQDSRANYPFKLEEAQDGQALVVVRHLGEERKFTITQVLAMLFTKLKGIASDTTECVISCPQSYTDIQKDALVKAALIAGLNPLQVISDMSAVVLNYAYYRTTKEDTHKFIAFINFGQSNLQCVVAWLTPRDDVVRILAAESESVGGRDFDQILADHFVDKHKLTLTPKAYLKLVFSCEKLKRLLSANANEIPINVESLISEDKDFTDRIDRATFESLSDHILKKVESCFQRALENAKINFDHMMLDIAESAKAAENARATEAARAVEAAKAAKAATAAREKAAAEAAAAAAAAQAKADAEAYAAKVGGEAGQKPAESNGHQEAVEPEEAKSPAGTTKTVPMEAEPEELTKAKAEEAKAQQEAKTAKSAEKAMSSQANKLNKMLDIKFDLQVVEMVGGSTRIPAIKQRIQAIFNLTPSTTLNTDEAVARGCVLHCATLHPGMKVRREVRILGSEHFYKLSAVCDKDSRKIEQDLIESDKKYKSRTEARNTLEEFIYAERSKLQEGDQYLVQLSETLDWLFSDEGEDASEESYLGKLQELKKSAESKLVENNN